MEYEVDAITTELSVAWAQHVDRLAKESGSKYSHEDDVWGVYDFVAALWIRERLESRLIGDATLREELSANSDEMFLQFTRNDDDGRLAEYIDPASTDLGWWWRRIPQSGPVADDLSGG